MISKQQLVCTQQALLRTANCSLALQSQFENLTKRVRSAYSVEKKERDNNRGWWEQSGFVRAGNFVLSHFISTAFVKTGLIGEKGLFTSKSGRKSLFSLPLSDSSVLVGPLLALGAFLSALKPPTLEPKAYSRLLTSVARLLCASYIRALRQLRIEDRPIGHGYELSLSDISKDTNSGLCFALGPLVHDIQSKLEELAKQKRDGKISRRCFLAFLKTLTCLRLCTMRELESSLNSEFLHEDDTVDYIAWCRWIRRHHTVSLGGSVSRRTIRGDKQKMSHLFASVLLNLYEEKSNDSSKYKLARNIAHELNPLQILITMLTCPLPRSVGTSDPLIGGIRSRKSKRFRMSQRLVGSMLCCGNVYVGWEGEILFYFSLYISLFRVLLFFPSR